MVPLIFLGTLTKLAFAVALTHTTRAWWLPGLIAIGLGTVAATRSGMTHTVGVASITLGAVAIAVAALLHRPRAR